MSLQTRLTALAQAVGADIKSLDTKISAVGGAPVTKIDGGAPDEANNGFTAVSNGTMPEHTHTHTHADKSDTTHTHPYSDSGHTHTGAPKLDTQTQVAVTALPRTYPEGLSVRFGDNSWITSWCVVHTHRVGFDINQIAYGITGNYVARRYSNGSTGDAWSPWRQTSGEHDLTTSDAARHAQVSLSGGGILNTEAAHVWWTQRFIAIGVGRGAHWASNGFFDILPPAAGSTVEGAYGAANRTVTPIGGIPLGNWETLWAVPTVGGTSTQVTLRVVAYDVAGTQTIPAHWIFVAGRNSDDGMVRWGNGETTDYPRTPTLQNGWTEYGDTWIRPRYWREGSMVFMQGLIRAGTLGAQLFVLPVGYRPAGGTHMPLLGSAGLADLHVHPDGRVLHRNAVGGNPVWLSLDNVSFRAVS